MPRGTTQFNNAVSADEVAPVLLVRVLDMPYKLYGALSFDGVDDYVDTTQQFDFLQTDSFTVEFWAKILDHSDRYAAAAGLVGKGHWYANNWDVFLMHSNSPRFELHAIMDGNVITGNPMPINKWQHIACVYNGSTKAMSLYQDGTLTATGTYTGTGDFNNDKPVWFGCRYNDSLRALRGWLTEVRIWNVARTQAEIQADMHRTLAGNEPGLVAYYSMRVPPTGNILPDLSPNNNDGTIYGATYVPITESLYLTDYQEKDVKTIDFFDENWNPCQYVCCNVKYDSIEVGADNTVNEVNITIDNVDRRFSALAQYYRLQGVEVHALVAERSVLDTPEGAVMKFAGKLKEARINEHAIILRVTSGYTLSCLIPKLMYDSKHFPYIPSAKDPRQVP